jgi:hypothetical protein
MARSARRKDSLELTPMAVVSHGDAARPSSGPDAADTDDGCKKLPPCLRCCSNKIALVVILALIILIALTTSLLLRSHDASDSSLAAPFILQSGLSFIAIGDWGRGGLYGQQETAITLAHWAASANVSFIVSVGDNFYPTGVSGVTDPQFDTSWRLVYSAPGAQRPWLSVFGESPLAPSS